jgi:tryptophan synthase beta chain
VAWVLGPGAAEAAPGTVDLVCLSGRGDKDLAEALAKLGMDAP